MRSWSIRRNLLALTLLAVALFLATALLLVASNHRYQARLALVTPHAVAQHGGDLAESNRQLREALHDREIALAVQARASDRLAIGGFVVAAVLAAIFCGLFVLDGVSGRIARWHRGLRRVRGMPDVGELTQNLERAAAKRSCAAPAISSSSRRPPAASASSTWTCAPARSPAPPSSSSSSA